MHSKAGSWGLWKLGLVLAVLLLLAALCTTTWIVSLRDRKWTALESRVETLFTELHTPPLERLPLGRTLLPGNAWDDYVSAGVSAPGQPPRIIASKLLAWLRRDPNANPVEAESLITEFSTNIEAIRQGTRRQSATAPSPQYAKGGIRYPLLLHYGFQDLSSLCIGKARLFEEAGELTEAVRLLVDVCLFGRDLAGARMSGGSTTALHVMRSAFAELEDLLERHNLSAEDLAYLTQSLKVLDDHFPDHLNDLRWDLLELGILLQREDDQNEDCFFLPNNQPRGRRNWRHCFSTRLQAAASFSDAESLVQRALATDAQPWSLAGPGNRELCAEASKDPLLEHSLLHLAAPQWTIPIRGQLRLLRVVVQYLETGKLLELDDPVGGKIRSRPSEQTVLFWRRALFAALDWEPKDAKRRYGYGLTIEVPRRQ
ncbi:MAG TPA: hypothetical protein VNM14_26645 [Planctomycetota bacterium]|jgi:hypothetical protein|nr:hypothetical protein [Planctomycetota bacterium]